MKIYVEEIQIQEIGKIKELRKGKRIENHSKLFHKTAIKNYVTICLMILLLTS